MVQDRRCHRTAHQVGEVRDRERGALEVVRVPPAGVVDDLVALDSVEANRDVVESHREEAFIGDKVNAVIREGVGAAVIRQAELLLGDLDAGFLPKLRVRPQPLGTPQTRPRRRW